MKTETEQPFNSDQHLPVTGEELLSGGIVEEANSVYTQWIRTKRTWPELREDVREIRRRLWTLGSRVPHSFTFRKLTDKTRVYFMSSPPNSRDNSVFAIDVPDNCPPLLRSSKTESIRFPWMQIIASDFQVDFLH